MDMAHPPLLLCSPPPPHRRNHGVFRRLVSACRETDDNREATQLNQSKARDVIAKMGRGEFPVRQARQVDRPYERRFKPTLIGWCDRNAVRRAGRARLQWCRHLSR